MRIPVFNQQLNEPSLPGISVPQVQIPPDLRGQSLAALQKGLGAVASDLLRRRRASQWAEARQINYERRVERDAIVQKHLNEIRLKGDELLRQGMKYRGLDAQNFPNQMQYEIGKLKTQAESQMDSTTKLYFQRLFPSVALPFIDKAEAYRQQELEAAHRGEHQKAADLVVQDVSENKPPSYVATHYFKEYLTHQAAIVQNQPLDVQKKYLEGAAFNFVKTYIGSKTTFTEDQTLEEKLAATKDALSFLQENKKTVPVDQYQELKGSLASLQEKIQDQKIAQDIYDKYGYEKAVSKIKALKVPSEKKNQLLALVYNRHQKALQLQDAVEKDEIRGFMDEVSPKLDELDIPTLNAKIDQLQVSPATKEELKRKFEALKLSDRKKVSAENYARLREMSITDPNTFANLDLDKEYPGLMPDERVDLLRRQQVLKGKALTQRETALDKVLTQAQRIYETGYADLKKSDYRSFLVNETTYLERVRGALSVLDDKELQNPQIVNSILLFHLEPNELKTPEKKLQAQEPVVSDAVREQLENQFSVSADAPVQWSNLQNFITLPEHVRLYASRLPTIVLQGEYLETWAKAHNFPLYTKLSGKDMAIQTVYVRLDGRPLAYQGRTSKGVVYGAFK